MSELKRWMDSDAPPDIEQMLRAAQDETPGSRLVDRTLAACGAGVVAAGLTHSAAAATFVHGTSVAGKAVGAAAGTTSVASGIVAVAAKWTVVGVLAAGGVTGGALGVRELSRPAPRSSATVQPTRERPAHAARSRAGIPIGAREVPEPTTSAHSEPMSANAASQRPASPADVDSDAPLVAEVVAIDEARARLARGDPRAALRFLNGYDQRFPERHLAPEALYLRMQALHQLGDQAGAKACAERLVSRYPTAPQVGRARELLSDQKP